MKRIFKKNQLIITALAALIAVAGYLNFAEKNMDEKAKEAAKQNAGSRTESDENQVGADVSDAEGDIVSGEQDVEGTPGEAIFVNASGTVDFIVEAKMSKEYMRVSNQETLQGIIADTKLTEAEKKSAVEKMVEITEVSEREMAAESLIMAKGYSDVVVTKTDEYVDVIIVANEMDTVTRAQIEDIVKRKMEVDADKITINVINVEGKNK